MGAFKNIKGRKFGLWTVGKYIGKSKWMCTCNCGAKKPVLSKYLVNKKSRSCGCASGRQFIDLIGESFGRWKVLRYLGNQNWLCKCQCGTKKSVAGGNLRGGLTKSCGCHNLEQLRINKPLRLIRRKFGRLTVAERAGSDSRSKALWLCHCRCGKTIILDSSRLTSGHTRSCGCLHATTMQRLLSKEIAGDKFFRLKIIRRIKGRKLSWTLANLWICKCDCGNKVEVDTKSLLSGNTMSCGCWNRDNAADRMKVLRPKLHQFMQRKYGVNHPMELPAVSRKIRRTMRDRYGASHPAQVPEIALRAARSANRITDLVNWETGEVVPCHGGYELAVVEWLNKKRIPFQWQLLFNMPDGRTYRVDLYLPDSDKYIEIKGYFRKDAKLKWDWFNQTYKNSELWDREKLVSLGIISHN